LWIVARGGRVRLGDLWDDTDDDFPVLIASDFTEWKKEWKSGRVSIDLEIRLSVIHVNLQLEKYVISTQ